MEQKPEHYNFGRSSAADLEEMIRVGKENLEELKTQGADPKEIENLEKQIAETEAEREALEK